MKMIYHNYSFIFCLIFMLWILLLPEGLYGLYGNPCKETGYATPSLRCALNEKCDLGKCVCDRYTYLNYVKGIPKCISNNVYSVEDISFITNTYGNINACKKNCSEDMTCTTDRLVCICKNSDQVLSHGKCLKPNFQKKPFEKCFGDSITVQPCEPEANLQCNSGKCVCNSLFYVDMKNPIKCIDKKNYTSIHKISSYKAMVNEYCLKSDDCITGLSCNKKFTCNCPSNCPHRKGQNVCDCGSINFSTPSGPIITGVILGVISVIIWGCCIHKTVSKYNKADRDYSEVSDVQLNEIPPKNEPETNDLIPDNPPPYEEAVGSSGIGFDISSMNKNVPSDQMAPNVPPANNPYNNPYPLNPTSTENSSAPYPLNQVPSDSTSAPYPTSGTAPYPASGTAPYPASGTAPYSTNETSPYPTSGSASYPSVSTYQSNIGGASNTPYPLSPNK